jgi:TRAP-type C4-dicarboxylate transport system permease large subunit
MVLGFFWYRTLSWKMLRQGQCLDTVETTATVLFIVAAASIFGWMLTATGVTATDRQLGAGVTKEPWLFLLLANLLMLFVGCFLEPVAPSPSWCPSCCRSCSKLGIDPVHFGLVMVLNLMIGLLHPPVGMVLFVLARVAKLSVERTTMAILPWLIPAAGQPDRADLRAADGLWLPRRGLMT